ncbi:calcium and integrin-binding family member 2-like [Anopheles albimanus]|uniref:calcium and integrin-binding family member 2-like n=1 Tax=Anopheles albimanus TaxID=7167 RepID=UPI001640D457|nr:calcium and integrin-binding family member 2-like [Anopheles albimanus]
MGANNGSPITEQQLEEYAELTYLSKPEIIFILQRLLNLDETKHFSTIKRYPEQAVVELFPQLKHNPFRDRLLYVFSSERDDNFSFEDLLDLFSVLSDKCPLQVKATWAFRLYDFDNDNLITKEDIMMLCDRLTKEEQLGQQEKQNIADLLLQEMDLQNNGNLAVFDFVHAISKMPEFQHTFSCRL